MDIQIEPYHAHQLEAVIHLSLRAWAPVFESLQTVIDHEVYHEFYPDWRESQQKAVADVCAAEDSPVWVAVSAGNGSKAIDTAAVVGFVAVKLHAESSMGEIYMIAVDPDAQGHGVGTTLMQFALSWIKDAGMAIAMVETGGDPGHAPARRTYEKLGFGLFPVARYFKKL